jgi:hypothetical protein
MKLLIIILLVSLSSLASTWMPVSVIQSKGSTSYALEADCLTSSGEQCLDLGQDPEMVKLGFATVENDWGPESEVETCDDEISCQASLQEKVCPGSLQKFIDANYTKVYCIELIGKKLIKDISGWQSHLSQQSALNGAIRKATFLRECGGRVMSLMLVRNQPKQLTTVQVKDLVATYASIKGLLESGSLVSAKEEIQAVAADGVLVTEADKEALSKEIDSCLVSVNNI